MKNRISTAALLLTILLSVSAVLSGCGGSSGPTAEDARKYVQAFLDILCTGEYDTSVRFGDVESGQELTLQDDMIEGVLSSLSEADGMNEENRTLFREFIKNALSKCRYTVGEAVQTDDNGTAGFDVPVTIEPLKVFEGAESALNEEISALQGDSEKLAGLTEEKAESFLLETVFAVLNRNLEDPHYDSPVEVTVHYGLIDQENKLYGVDENAGSEVGELLFSTEGLQ